MTTGKLKVGVLGATGMVGQRFVQLLADHPWFELAALGASERSAGKVYKDAAQNWKLTAPIPESARDIPVTECSPEHFKGCRLVFSGLDNSIAGDIETVFALAGIAVFSNAKNHRYDTYVPLVVPTVNAEHLDIIPTQRTHAQYPAGGFIVTNANCSSTGLCVPLKALDDAFGLDTVMVTTMQAISGAGYPGVASLDIMDNVVPYISGEEDKMETEPRKILGGWSDAGFSDAGVRISAHCNRVPVTDGHTECVSIKLKRKASPAEVASALRGFVSEAQRLGVPSAPKQCIHVTDEPNRPQPRLDRDLGRGFTVSVGRVRECPVFDVKFVMLSHNTIIGAAGGAIMNAELAKVKGYLD